MYRIYIGILLIAGIVAMGVYFFLFSGAKEPEIITLSQLSPLGLAIGAWGYIGTFGIWVWMLTDLFKAPSMQHRAAWGWFMLIGTFVTAVLYFFIIYVSRIRAEVQKNK